MSFTITMPKSKIVDVHNSLMKRNNKAAYRTINWLESESKKTVRGDVRNNYPVAVGTINRRWRTDKAKSSKHQAEWHISGRHMGLPMLRQLAHGIAFTGLGAVKHKLTSKIDGGTRPFMITVGKKKIGVYVAAQDLRERHGKNRQRPVKTLAGVRLATVLHKVKYMRSVKNIFRNRYAKRYGIELDKAKF